MLTNRSMAVDDLKQKRPVPPSQIINFLLTEREVCTEKYRTKVFLV
jgi:hypothetical protein